MKILEYLGTQKRRTSGWRTTSGTNLFNPQTRGDVAITIAVLMGLLLTMSTVAYAVGMVTQGEQYTEFYLLTENESGDITARNYPTEFRRGESKHLVVGIHNHEHQTANYTVVAMIQRVSDGNSSTTVRNQEDQGRFSVTITHNETRYRRMQIKPRLTGDRLRLVFLLYRGTLPDDPTVANAYRTLHLRVNVSTG